MIISASRRTDVPAFYSEWFCRRLQEGFVLVRNPMNPRQVSRVSLSPAVVDCFVFWTKNPRPMLNKLPLLSEYDYYFQFTLNPYDHEIEVNLPPKAELIETFAELSDRIGKQRVVWRYDPIFLTAQITEDDHLRYFQELASKLRAYTEKCIISFLDLYKKTARNLNGIPKVACLTEEQIFTLAKGFAEIAGKFGLTIETCAEEVDLDLLGIEHGKCIDDRLIQRITGAELAVEKDKFQRKECGCVNSIDIGAYNTCAHQCLYCYANSSNRQVSTNRRRHQPASPLLYGNLTAEDLITEKTMVSCKAVQGRLF
ncbi:MAG TPA: DUF1848 domain-containing protein [Firmicutes bacterium]|nr:DUF1848 domain-containing protein [Bacillota bacterium]